MGSVVPPKYHETLKSLAEKINQTKRNIWEIGDTLVRLHEELGESYWQFIHDLARLTGSTDRTLDRWRWIASRVPPAERLGLSVYHHEELLPLPPPIRLSLAEKAKSEGLSVGELRELKIKLTGSFERRVRKQEERTLLQALLAILVEMRSKDLEEALLTLRKYLRERYILPRQQIKDLLEEMEEIERLSDETL